MSQVVEMYAGNKNINKLIAEHIPSKMAKQISDKRRLLMKSPAAVVPSGIEGELHMGEEEPSQSIALPQEGQLKLQYWDDIWKGLSACRFPKCQKAFERILDGQDPQGMVNDAFEDCFSGLKKLSQTTKATKASESQRSRGQRASKTTANWMQKRAKRKGKYLRFQRLFDLHRGRLARLILDNSDTLQCEIPSGVVYSTFKARWETSVEFKGLETFQSFKEADNNVFWALITDREAEKNLKEMKRTSAPGPDGFTVGHLVKLDPKYTLMTETFNLWLASGTVPDALRRCRTVLIPKSSDPERLRDINNWRPITIASVVLR